MTLVIYWGSLGRGCSNVSVWSQIYSPHPAGCVKCLSTQSLEVSGPEWRFAGRKGEGDIAGSRMEEGQLQSRGDIVGHFTKVSVRVSEVDGHNGSFYPSSRDWTLLNGNITSLKWRRQKSFVTVLVRDQHLIPYSGLEDPCTFLTSSLTILPFFTVIQPLTDCMASGRVLNCSVS